MDAHTLHEEMDAAELELDEHEYMRSPLAEIGHALINISEGARVWGALAQASANIANHEGNALSQRRQYERLSGFCDWMSGHPWRRLTLA